MYRFILAVSISLPLPPLWCRIHNTEETVLVPSLCNIIFFLHFLDFHHIFSKWERIKVQVGPRQKQGNCCDLTTYTRNKFRCFWKRRIRIAMKWTNLILIVLVHFFRAKQDHMMLDLYLNVSFFNLLPVQYSTFFFANHSMRKMLG